MILADIGDNGYNIVLFIHIFTVVAAFAPMFVVPFVNRQTAGEASVRSAIYSGIAQRSMQIHGSALIVAGLLGFALAGMSDEIFKMSQGWMVASFLVWIAMNGLLHALIVPGEKAIAAGDESKTKNAEMAGMAMSVLFLVMLYLMIFKPGL